jgi:hypothetical protein
VAQILADRLTRRPPSVCEFQKDIPAELDAVIARMLAVDTGARYPTPEAVMEALLPFIDGKSTKDPLIRLTDRQSCEPSGVGNEGRPADSTHLNSVLALSLARLGSLRDRGKGGHRHLFRLQRYCRSLAEAAMQSPAFRDEIDADFVVLLECCVPLHDIGMIAMPDHVFFKPGRLDTDERLMIETHAQLGADFLRQLGQELKWDARFLQMALNIIQQHHERFDGTGYPQQLRENEIPLAARITMHRRQLRRHPVASLISTGNVARGGDEIDFGKFPRPI